VRTDRDYYRVLGIDRQATPEQIKQRYRELVRQHHPDVNPNQHPGLGHNTFLQIVEAYQILSDADKRREYDRIWERRAPAASGSGPQASAASGGASVIETLVLEARKYFEARNYSETIRACRRIIQLDKENAVAYELLGDVYGASKRNEEAISYYTMAQQFSQSRKTELGAKIDRLMKREDRLLHEAIHGKPVYKRAPVMAVLCVSLLMLAFWGFSISPGSPIEGFPPLGDIPLPSLLLFFADAFLLGALLSGTMQIGRFDDEMLFSLAGERVSGNAPPLGLLLPVISILNFYLSLLCYILYALMHERFSLSIPKAAFSLLLLALVFAAPHPDSLPHLLIFGTGPGFAIMCGGWLLADMIRPHWS
jgi:curved DNA-binding protein CbpA